VEESLEVESLVEESLEVESLEEEALGEACVYHVGSKMFKCAQK